MITTDTGAKKIEGTDNWRQIFDIHNDSVDAYDANVAALQDALGIVVDGNQSAVSASSGQFIILKNSSIVDSGTDMLPDGLYTAAKAIPANTVIDKTYLTADASGGLNALNGKLANIQKPQSSEYAVGDGVYKRTFIAKKTSAENAVLVNGIGTTFDKIIRYEARIVNSQLITVPYYTSDADMFRAYIQQNQIWAQTGTSYPALGTNGADVIVDVYYTKS